MNKYVTEMLHAEDVDTNQPSSTPALISASSSSMHATIPVNEDNGPLFLWQTKTTGIMTATLVGYQKPCAGSYVTKPIFEKLIEPSNGENCAVITVAWNPLWKLMIGALMNELNI